jgi:hypothetical protein
MTSLLFEKRELKREKRRGLEVVGKWNKYGNTLGYCKGVKII